MVRTSDVKSVTNRYSSKLVKVGFLRNYIQITLKIVEIMKVRVLDV